MPEPHSIDPSGHTVWRVGRNFPDAADRYAYRNPEPVSPSDGPRQGNRFDSYNSEFGVLYFGTSLEVCYAETLARFRPNPVLAAMVADEWREMGAMGPGNMPADWRSRRIITQVRLPTALPLVDIQHPDTLAALNADEQLMAACLLHGVDEIDLGVVCGPDRRLTRLIASSLYRAVGSDGQPRWSGVVYPSRLGIADSGRHTCWAVFEGTEIEELATKSILKADLSLGAVAERYGLTIH